MTRKKWPEFAVGRLTNLHWSVELTHLFLGHLTNFGRSCDLENLALNHLTQYFYWVDFHWQDDKAMSSSQAKIAQTPMEQISI